MFIEHLLGSSHCGMFQRDLNRCGPSPERAQGVVRRRAKSQGTVNHVTCQGAAAPAQSLETGEGHDGRAPWPLGVLITRAAGWLSCSS